MAGKIQGEINAFKDFISKGNVIDLAVAFVIGAAFQAFVSSLATNLITPVIGVFGHYNFSDLSFTVNGSAFHYGLAINSTISFILLSLIVFFFIVRPISKINSVRNKGKKDGPATKTCPYCISVIPIGAVRCPNCTSDLKADK